MRSHRQDPVARRLEGLGFDRAAAARLSVGGTLLDIAAGRTICREGEVGLEAFLILDGEVRVLVDGRELTLGRGEIFGELAALDATRTRNATVVADTDLTLLVFDVRTFRTLAGLDGLRARLTPVRSAA
jgi:CPA1 family monovalent cation:H+ antiporter